MEEYVLKPYLWMTTIVIFYFTLTDRPSLWENQNTIEEVHQPYIETHAIDVVRRISGVAQCIMISVI